MRHVNRQIYANETLKWFDQFATLGKWNVERQQRLRDLGPKPKPEDVDRIMGGPWTSAQCSECGLLVDEAVELDVKDKEHGNPVVLCIDCIDAAEDTFYEHDLSE
jgi:hypothetical protein